MDFFQLFGVERRLQLDGDSLQTRFYQLSREFHPDRFAARPVPERLAAEQQSAMLNDAYRVLREPLARAEYVLRQAGFDIGEQRTKDVPPELLEEVFELNMALEEARMGDEDARGQLRGMHDHFLQMQSAIDQELNTLFGSHDAVAAGGGSTSEVLQQIRAVLNRRRYVRNLVSEVEKELAQ
jgi:molecular chaperone HscB